MENGFEIEVRQLALRYVESLQMTYGDKVPAAEIKRPFQLADKKIVLASFAEGVFRPKGFQYVLSILSTLSSHYTDQFNEEKGLLTYALSPRAYLNDTLRANWQDSVPLIALLQVTPKPNPEYMIISPVFVTGEADGYFFISTLEASAFRQQVKNAEGILLPRAIPKAYKPISTQLRLHQAAFRKEILGAYKTRCCVCELKAKPLLDASHIVPDTQGEAHVSNGLCLCAIHHRAFDANVLNVRPDYTVAINSAQIQGPQKTLDSLFMQFKDQKIVLPGANTLWPKPEYLEKRLLVQ